MRQLTEREVRFLCWKVKQGRQLPEHKLASLLTALLTRKSRPVERRAANDNTAPFGPGCRERSFLFQRYERSVTYWMQRVVALSSKAGKRSKEYPALWRQVVEARAGVARARRDYERHLADHGCGHPDRDDGGMAE